jgi:hypothetical protein
MMSHGRVRPRVVTPRPEPRVVGVHVSCGGRVMYHVFGHYAFRRCELCGQDGSRGTPSPDVE